MTMTATGTDAGNTGADSPHIPGEVGIWVFVFGDLIIFTLFFGTFLYYRGFEVELYNNAQDQLNQLFGVLNTIVMLSSSWLVATAVHAARLGRAKVPAQLLFGGFLCGAAFIIIKFFEYGEKISAGITISTNDFFMYYFIFTGIHGIHVLIGMGVLLYLTQYCRKRTETLNPAEISTLESGATFWHLVDLLWIILFALLYLVH